MSLSRLVAVPRRRLENRIRRLVGLPQRRKHAYIEFFVSRGSAVNLYLSDVHQNRNEATAHMLLEAVKTTKYKLRQDKRLIICTDDRPPEDSEPMMCYAPSPDMRNRIAIPDFTFWDWPDVGIDDYPSLTAAMVEAGKAPPQDDRLFWIGNPKMHENRQRLVDIAADDPRMLATGITWVKADRPENHTAGTLMGTRDANYVSLPDHCRHKYLIDVEGYGYSARLKILLFSGRPVFIQERPWREFFHDWLEPFVHFIPVRRDLSDLSAQIEWAEGHPEECREIAANAQAFAQRHLTREAAIAYLREVIDRELA